MRALCFLLIFVAAIGREQVTYHGHKVIKAMVTNKEQGDFLIELSSEYDFWSEVGIGRFKYKYKSCLNLTFVIQIRWYSLSS